MGLDASVCGRGTGAYEGYLYDACGSYTTTNCISNYGVCASYTHSDHDLRARADTYTHARADSYANNDAY